MKKLKSFAGYYLAPSFIVRPLLNNGVICTSNTTLESGNDNGYEWEE